MPAHSSGSSPAGMLGVLVQQAVTRPVRHTSKVDDELTPEEAQGRLREVVQHRWADLERRQVMWMKCQRWLQAHRRPCTADNVLLWVFAQQVATTSQAAYLALMAGIFREIGQPREPLVRALAMVRAVGANQEPKQAVPLTATEVSDLVRRWPDMALPMMIAWKTASRWGDVENLRRKDFIWVSDDEVIVDWGTLPKGRRGDPNVPARWTVIRGRWVDVIARMVRQTGGRITTVSTSMLDRRLADSGMPWTAHSFKVGATRALLQQGVDWTLLQRLLKHSEGGAVTVRYMTADPLAAARALRTGELTLLL